VQCGIDSISVNNDAVVRTRQLIASFEQKLTKKTERNPGKNLKANINEGRAIGAK
jgi:hypothetical protein